MKEDITTETRDRIVNLARDLEKKIPGLEFKGITSDIIQFDENFTASTVLFAYNSKEIELSLGFSDRGDIVSIPQDLKVNYNFEPHEPEGIKESIERCLKNGW